MKYEYLTICKLEMTHIRIKQWHDDCNSIQNRIMRPKGIQFIRFQVACVCCTQIKVDSPNSIHRTLSNKTTRRRLIVMSWLCVDKQRGVGRARKSMNTHSRVRTKVPLFSVRSNISNSYGKQFIMTAIKLKYSIYFYILRNSSTTFI